MASTGFGSVDVETSTDSASSNSSGGASVMTSAGVGSGAESVTTSAGMGAAVGSGSTVVLSSSVIRLRKKPSASFGCTWAAFRTFDG